MAVEAALVTPVIVLLVFGIIEFTFALRDHVAVSSAVRVGARIGSTGAGAGAATCEPVDDAPPCAPESSPALAQAAADAIQRAGSAMPKDSIDYILVYKSNEEGYPGSDGSTTLPSSCDGVADCVRFTWRPNLDKFRFAGGTWDSRNINACFPNSDSLGVYMHVTHEFITHLFGDTIGLGDRAVMKFEPLAHDICAADVRP